MSVRYLYADSESFPHGFDFLSTLRGFLVAATSSIDALTELDRLGNNIAAERERGEQAKRAIDVFVDTIIDSVELAVARNPGPDLIPRLGRSIQEFVRRSAEASKAEREMAFNALLSEIEREADVHRGAVRESVDGFFLRHELDVLDATLRIAGRDEGYDARLECTFPAGVDVCYALDASKTDDWRAPFRLTEIAPNVEIQVGMKRKLLSRDLRREVARLDELVVGSLELTDDSIQLGLKRRLDQPDALRIHLFRVEDEPPRGTVERPDHEEESRFPVADEDRTELERLWQRAIAATRPLLLHRRRVISATLDGENIYEPSQASKFFDRYVELIAPTLREIAQRSPSKKELSLKIEHEDGRREELYLRKEELGDIVGTFSERKARVLAPLEVFPMIEVAAEEG